MDEHVAAGARRNLIGERARVCALCPRVGEHPLRIIVRHIIPGVLPTIIVAATLNIASAILMESTLSFLGLGVQAPAASWGSMLNNAQSYIGEASWLAMFPGILILLTVFSFNVLGDVFRTAFEPSESR